MDNYSSRIKQDRTSKKDNYRTKAQNDMTVRDLDKRDGIRNTSYKSELYEMAALWCAA